MYDMGAEIDGSMAEDLRRRATLHEFRAELQSATVDSDLKVEGVGDRMLAVFIRDMNDALKDEEPVSEGMEAMAYQVRELFREACEDGAPTSWEEEARKPASRMASEAQARTKAGAKAKKKEAV